MQIDSSTPKKEITIKGHVFTVPAPYTEGHVLTVNEANVLNQTLAENLRNNFASAVTAAQEEAAKEGSTQPFNLATLQEQLDAYVTEYEFGTRKAGTSVAVNPVHKIALRMARDLVKKSLVKQGKNVKDVSAEQLQALAEKVVQNYPAIMDAAQKEYDNKKEINDTIIADLAA